MSVRASVALLRKTHKPANRVTYTLSNPTSTLRVIACDISPNVRDVFGREGMKVKSLRHGYGFFKNYLLAGGGSQKKPRRQLS